MVLRFLTIGTDHFKGGGSSIEVGIENLIIDFAQDNANAGDYSTGPYGYVAGTSDGWKGQFAIDFQRVRDGNISNETIAEPASHGIKITQTVNSTFDNIAVSGAQSRLAGNGYHFIFEEAFGNTASSLASEFATDATIAARHSLHFWAFSAEQNNTIHFTTAISDINFHGGIDTGNTITIDTFDYSSYAGSDLWQAVPRDVAPVHSRHGPDSVDLDGNGISDFIDRLE